MPYQRNGFASFYVKGDIFKYVVSISISEPNVVEVDLAFDMSAPVP